MGKLAPGSQTNSDLTYTKYAHTVALPQKIQWKLNVHEYPPTVEAAGAYLISSLYATKFNQISAENVLKGVPSEKCSKGDTTTSLAGLMRLLRSRGSSVGGRKYKIDAYLHLQGLSEWRQALYNIGPIVVGKYVDEGKAEAVAVVVFGYDRDGFFGVVGDVAGRFNNGVMLEASFDPLVPLIFTCPRVKRTINVKALKSQLSLIDAANRSMI